MGNSEQEVCVYLLNAHEELFYEYVNIGKANDALNVWMLDIFAVLVGSTSINLINHAKPLLLSTASARNLGEHLHEVVLIYLPDLNDTK